LIDRVYNRILTAAFEGLKHQLSDNEYDIKSFSYIILDKKDVDTDKVQAINGQEVDVIKDICEVKTVTELVEVEIEDTEGILEDMIMTSEIKKSTDGVNEDSR